jgi:hypothetical protein
LRHHKSFCKKSNDWWQKKEHGEDCRYNVHFLITRLKSVFAINLSKGKLLIQFVILSDEAIVDFGKLINIFFELRVLIIFLGDLILEPFEFKVKRSLFIFLDCHLF